MLQQVNQQVKTHGQPFDGSAEALRLAKGGSGLLHDLKLLLQERNLSAHGGRPRNHIQAGSRLLDLTPSLEDAVTRAAPLADADWIFVESSSFGRDGLFHINALKVMGDHPEFERIEFRSSHPLVDRDLYFASTSGYINLTPYAVMRYCNRCKESELCYADRVDERKGVVLKSFANGHEIFDPQLAADLTSPFDGPGAATTG